MLKGLSLLAVILMLCAAGTLSAETVTYVISVDTSSVDGTAGSLDFQFNPGPLVTQAADLEVFDFTPNASLAGSSQLTGDVSGALDSNGTVTFDNGSGYNDYFEGFTYGNSLTFDVTFSGPALTSPDGVSTSGSVFAFSMFSDAAGTVPVLTTDTTDGWAVLLNVNLDGSTTPTNLSNQTTVTPQSSGVGTSVPEPPSLILLATGVLSAFGLSQLRGRLTCLNGDSRR